MIQAERSVGVLPHVGDKVYDIKAGGQNWAAVGNEVRSSPRVGLPAPHLSRDRLSVVLHVTNYNPAEIPPAGLSVYLNGQNRIADEGAWHLVSCTPAGELRIVELST
jgi:hypothetical protein